MLDLIIKNGQCYIDNKLVNIDLGIKEGKIVEIENISKQSKEKLENVVELAKSLDFDEIAFDLIYGLPFQSISSLEKTFKYLLDLLNLISLLVIIVEFSNFFRTFLNFSISSI